MLRLSDKHLRLSKYSILLLLYYVLRSSNTTFGIELCDDK